MNHATVENPDDRRNRLNYETDVVMDNQSETGIREYAPFNYIPHFHVIDSSAEDITHNVEGGVCHYNFLECMYHFIYNEQYFTLDVLNDRMRSFPYAIDEITFIIGDLVPVNDVVWHFLLSTVQFYDFCYSPGYENQSIEEWRSVISDMLNYYQHLFNCNLKPVHHMAIHYPNDTLKFGPLRYTRTIR